MNLKPTPKPIRIRIKSAGEEHSSLDSLRLHFKFDDILPLVKDGRFSRWLRQISQNDIADQIDSIRDKKNVDEDTIKFRCIGILFNNTAIRDEKSLLDFFYKENRKNYLSEQSSLSPELMKSLLENPKVKNAIRGDLALLLGNLSEDRDIKLSYFKEAEKLGVEEAKNYLQVLSLEVDDVVDIEPSSPQEDLQNSIKILIDAYNKAAVLKATTFPEQQGWIKSMYSPYYRFFKYAYTIRTSKGNGELRELYWKTDTSSVEPIVRDSYNCLGFAMRKCLGLKNIETITSTCRIPNRVKKALQEQSSTRWDMFVVIDRLCESYWDYLTIQNKRYNLW